MFIVTFSSYSETTQQNYIKPEFGDTPALLVEKCARELPIIDLISASINKSEKVLVSSFEKAGHNNSFNNYIIEDNLIYNLVSNGYIALERNQEMLNRINEVQETHYYSYSTRNFPHHPIFLLLKFLEDKGLEISKYEEVTKGLIQEENSDSAEISEIINNMASVDIERLIELYQMCKNDYTNNREVARNRLSLVTADVIISYRVLEAGLFYKVENIEDGSVSQNLKLAHSYDCGAMIRLFIRITDAKTGEIRNAGIVEKKLSEIVEFKQIQNESDTHYFERIKEYIRFLEDNNYQFYSQSLPHQNIIKSDNTSLGENTITQPVIEEKKIQIKAPIKDRPKISAGLKAGTNIGWFSGEDWTDGISSVNGVNRGRMGITAAAFIEAGIADWIALQPEIGYSSKKGGAEYNFEGETAKETIKVDVVDLTLFLKPRFSVGKGLFYGLIGPQLSFILGDITAEVTVDGESDSLDSTPDKNLLVGIGLGSGYSHPLGSGRILFDFIYSHSFTSIVDDADIFINGSALTIGYAFVFK